MSSDEVEEIQSAIDQNYDDLRQDNLSSSNNAEEDSRQSEVELMQEQLNKEKELLVADLWAKLKMRREQEHLEVYMILSFKFYCFTCHMKYMKTCLRLCWTSSVTSATFIIKGRMKEFLVLHILS